MNSITNLLVILNEYPINNNYSFDFLKLFEEVNVKQESSIIIYFISLSPNRNIYIVFNVLTLEIYISPFLYLRYI